MIIVISYPLVWISLSLVFLLAPKRKIERMPRLNQKPLVSVIIPARDEESVIQNVLLDCVNQTYEKSEVLVVAHNCTDGTAEKAGQVANEHPNIKVYDLRTQDAGKGIALNFGLRHSRGSVIVCFDADSKVEKDYIENGLKCMSAGYAAVQGRIVGKNVFHNLLTLIQHLENLISMNIFWGSRFAMNLDSGLGGTGVMVERRALEKIGGWRNVLIEDFDLFLRLKSEGFEIALAEDCLVRDEKVPHWSALIRQRARWIAGHFQLLKAINHKTLRHPLDLWKLSAPIYLTSLYVSLLFGLSAFFFNLLAGKVPFLLTTIPFHAWLLFFVTMNCLFSLVLIKAEGLKKGLLYTAFLPVFYIFTHHWYIALLKSFTVRSWASTKTEHGFG